MTVNVYHKHSVVKGKAPDAKQLELGEIAINANQDSPAIYIKDSADNIVEIGAGCDCDAIHKELERLEELINNIGDIPDPETLEKVIKKFQEVDFELNVIHDQVDEHDDKIKDLLARVEILENRVDSLQKNVDLLALHDVEHQKDIEDLQGRVETIEKMKIVAGQGIVLKKTPTRSRSRSTSTGSTPVTPRSTCRITPTRYEDTISSWTGWCLIRSDLFTPPSVTSNGTYYIEEAHQGQSQARGDHSA